MTGAAADPRLTEATNPRTEAIDTADTATIVAMIQAEDRAVPAAVASQSRAIARVVDEVAERLRRGGRLIYVGAGTSGRLGVLDAAECPPTFGTDPGLVQGIIAGGPEALVRSSESAEDDARAGAAAVSDLGVGPADLVLGIATSGTTPFVHGALEEAHARRAGLAFLSCTEPPASIVELGALTITPLTGPEVIAGSTRLKAGTATKLVLNTITTAAMIRSGKVYGNLMVDLRARSAKLVDRGIRIVVHVCGLDPETARRTLVEAGGSVKTALAMRMLGLDRATAERRLDAADGFLRIAVDGDGSVPPDSYYSAYPPEPDRGDEPAALLDTLGATAGRLRAARTAARAIDERGTRVRLPGPRWSDAQHVTHLADFEEEAIRPRVERFLSEDDPALASWEPSDPPGNGAEVPFEDAVARFEAARRDTLALLAAGSDPWARRALVGRERVTLYQFLRGIRQHDAAHVVRIRERVHPALLETRGGP